MTVPSIPVERALPLAKFLIQALGEALDLVSRPWDAVSLEQAYDPATPPFGMALVADRLRLAADAIAEVAPFPRRATAASGFSKDHARKELDDFVRLLGMFVVAAGRAEDAGALSLRAGQLLTTIGVSVDGMRAEAEKSAWRIAGRSAASAGNDDCPPTERTPTAEDVTLLLDRLADVQRRFDTGEWEEGADALAMLRETHEITARLKRDYGLSDLDIETAFRKRLKED